jgi:hypothetical protein
MSFEKKYFMKIKKKIMIIGFLKAQKLRKKKN